MIVRSYTFSAQGLGFIIFAMAASGNIRCRTLVAALGLPDTQARSYLARWVNEGKLVRRGTGKGTYYIPGPRWDSWVDTQIDRIPAR